ncbi:5' nucleotidase, NT5C type [Ningiella sp. W23]|uniref:5' nucleotidase, NT5C type n=1 Tax=Ningiella sp. W23 TaxID=3023715 RepID=UPI0037570C0E
MSFIEAKPVMYIDMDNVIVDFPSAFKHLSDETKAQYAGRLDEVPNIFSMMKPMRNAVQSVEALSKQFDVYVLSTAPWENRTAWSDKLDWVKKYLGSTVYKRLILSHNKHLNTGAYLIDDRLANGADRFTGEHVHFGTERFPDWASVLDYLGV